MYSCQTWILFKTNESQHRTSLTYRSPWKTSAFVQKLPAGALVEVDISCDSALMRRTEPDIDANILLTMHWMPRAQPVNLAMDNA